MNRRDRDAEAAATLRKCREVLAARSGTVIGEATGSAQIVDWRHYPAGEVYDSVSHAQYFYHRHPAVARHRGEPAEHGHFHLFLRGEGIPAGVTPLVLPELAVANAPPPPQSAPQKRGSRDEVCHIVAIAVDGAGEPIRLFTTNRWVTGETWYRAADVTALLERFRVSGDRPSVLLNRWLGAVVRLFRGEIAALLRQRDEAITEWRLRRPRGNPFEDPRLETTSSVDIDLAARLAMVEASLAGSPQPAGRRAALLPRMAEGWGA